MDMEDDARTRNIAVALAALAVLALIVAGFLLAATRIPRFAISKAVQARGSLSSARVASQESPNT